MVGNTNLGSVYHVGPGLVGVTGGDMRSCSRLGNGNDLGG